MANYRLREDVTAAQLEKGRDTAKKRSGFVLYHDYLRTLKEMLTDEQIGIIVIALAEYAETFETKEFNDPVIAMAYKMGINGIERDVEKYATTCANRSAAASEREGKKKHTRVDNGNADDSTNVQTNNIKEWTIETTLQDAVNDFHTVKEALQGYAEANRFWIPSDELCDGVRANVKRFIDWPLYKIIGFLQNHLDGETDEQAIDQILGSARL